MKLNQQSSPKSRIFIRFLRLIRETRAIVGKKIKKSICEKTGIANSEDPVLLKEDKTLSE